MPNDAPTWEDTVDVPSWEDTKPLESDFRRDELKKQTFQARLEGEQAKALTGLTDVGTEAAKAIVRAASHVDPTGFTQGLMQQYGVEHAPPIVPLEKVLPDVETVSKFAQEGLGNLGIQIPEFVSKPAERVAGGFISSLPEMAPALITGAYNPEPIARLFQAQMLAGVPASGYAAVTAQEPEQAVEAGLQTALGLAIPAHIESNLRPRVQMPMEQQRLSETRQGALPPLGEPTAPIERVTPEQSALAAERMSAPFEGKLSSEPSILAPEKTEVPKFEETTPLEVKAESINPVDVKQGDVIRWEPNAKERRYQSSVEGIVQDVIQNTEGETGYHIFAPTKDDPTNVVRVWANRGEVVSRTPATVEVQRGKPVLGVGETASEGTIGSEIGAGRNPNRPKSVVEIADEIAARGVDPQASYGEFVKARNLKPEIDNKEWLPIYRQSLKLAKLKREAEITRNAPEPPPAKAEGAKPFQVDDQLIMRSPHTGDDTSVSFRGLLPNGQAVVWTGKSQFPVPVEWLRREGEKYVAPAVSDIRVTIPDIRGVPDNLRVPSENVAPLVQLEKLSKDQLVDVYRNEVPLSKDTLKSTLIKRTQKSLREDIETARGDNIRQELELSETRKVEPEIKAIADAAGASWRTALNKYATDRGWSFHPPADTTKGEYVAMLALEQAKQNLKKPAPPPEVAKGAEAETAAIPPTQAIPQGPGARTGTATVEMPESYSGTALKHAVDAIERVGWNMRDAPERIRKNIAEAWIRAEGILKGDPKAGEKLVDELIANPEGRGLDFDESALLLRQKLILTEQMNDAAGRTHTAKTAAEKAQATADFDSAHEKMLNMLDAIHKRGTAWGEEGRWRQVMAQEDYSLGTLLINRERALGKQILPGTPEYIELEGRAQRLQELNNRLTERIAKLEAESNNADVKRAIAEEVEAAKKEVPYHPRIIELAEGYAKELDSVGSKALTELREMFAALEQMPQGPGARTYRAETGITFNKDMFDRAARYGAAKIGRKISEFEAWKDSMVADIGPGFERYAKDVWLEANRQFNAFVDAKLRGKPESITRKVKSALKGAELGTETILKRIAMKAEKTAGGKLPDIKYQLRKLARYHIANGIKEEGPLIDALHSDVLKVLPDLSREDVRAIFAGYAAELKTLSKEANEVILRDLSGQNREIYKLGLLKRKIIPPKLQDRAIPSQKERTIRKQVEAEKRTGGFAPPDPEAQLRSALQSKETRLLNQIMDMQQEIDANQKMVKEKRDPSTNDRIEALIEHRKLLKEIYDDVFKKPDLTNAERLEIWKDRVREKIEELRDRRARKDFKRKPKPDPIRYDKEAIELQYQKEVEQRALEDMRIKDELSKRTVSEVILDSAKMSALFSHFALAGGEFSAVGKQGAIGLFSNPIRTARNFAKSIETLWSEKAQFDIKHDILTRENSPNYRRDHLSFSDVGGRLSSMEEMTMFRAMDWMKKVPVLSHYVRYMEGFQRAFSTFLNLMRADTYDALYKENPAAGEAIANFINVSTGRGSHSVARFGGAGPNAIFFAPRWSISRFQYLFGQPIFHAKREFRGLILKQYAKTFIGLGSMYALATAAGGKTDWDPRSALFGKIQIGGRVLDPLFGLAPVIRLLAQEISGTRKNARGQIRPVRESLILPKFEKQIQGSRKVGPYDPSGAELIGRFAWSKLAPAPEMFVSAAGGENVIGENFSIPDRLWKQVTPITYKDILGAMIQEGVDEKTAIDLLAFWGFGSYIPKQKQSQPQPNW